jgi:hypothetical protein
MSYSQFVEGVTQIGSQLAKPVKFQKWGLSNLFGGWPYEVGRFNGPEGAKNEAYIQDQLFPRR